MRRVLVVDDKEENLRLVRKALAGAGFAVEGVRSAEEALELAARGMPNLVLMDLRLPGGLTGYEAARRLRELPGGDGVLIVAVSASPTLSDEGRIRAAGFDGFLLKPIDVAALPEQVRGYLSRREAREER